jgi:MoxR-like ATPase
MNEFLAVESLRPLKLRPALTAGHKSVDNYKPATGFMEAVDVAMLLGVPLLLTGEPGSGKTSSADWLAGRLNAGKVLRHDVKSTTSGRELLYTFDEVARFRDSSGSDKVEVPLIKYIQFTALGEAIIRAAGGGEDLLAPDRNPLVGEAFEANRGQLVRAFGKDALAGGRAPVSLLLPNDREFVNAAAEHRVVLIDELDKAPRDTPNDLLAEIDDMGFAIPELGIRIEAGSRLRPVVIITSNSEKALPEPFLRRCAYFNIPEATDEQLQIIVEGAIDGLSDQELVKSAIRLFRELRRNPTVQKKPGTSELLAWLDVMIQDPRNNADMSVEQVCRALVQGQPEEKKKWPAIGALLKWEEDVEIAMAHLLK